MTLKHRLGNNDSALYISFSLLKLKQSKVILVYFQCIRETFNNTHLKLGMKKNNLKVWINQSFLLKKCIGFLSSKRLCHLLLINGVVENNSSRLMFLLQFMALGRKVGLASCTWECVLGIHHIFKIIKEWRVQRQRHKDSKVHGQILFLQSIYFSSKFFCF